MAMAVGALFRGGNWQSPRQGAPARVALKALSEKPQVAGAAIVPPRSMKSILPVTPGPVRVDRVTGPGRVIATVVDGGRGRGRRRVDVAAKRRQ